MSENHLDQLSVGTASIFDANLLIFKSLLEFERQRLEEIKRKGVYATVPCIYKELKRWFETQTSKEYTLQNLEVQIEEYSNFENHSED